MLDRIGRLIAAFLQEPVTDCAGATPFPFDALLHALRPCDVILIEGNTRISSPIKYLTQSTWSHSALYVGQHRDLRHAIIEADLEQGVIIAAVEKYKDVHIRICRPSGLNARDQARITRFAAERVGNGYDLQNVFDLIRYLVPLPVPRRFRRRMISLGSGDPTRAICSTLIAQAFQHVGYPILPRIETHDPKRSRWGNEAEIMHIRHHSLFVPRDFDLSPFFEIVKPPLRPDFDFHDVEWSSAHGGAEAAST
ncbi:MAG TPA: lipo-like protein [Aurantimonas coralicida]|uniref:Lipo-like protein n=2 Tax=root TaxID=1 RepID=A0A9C9NF32_9HYPH|nr:lipo-like protein [Aurantimonas coralicida]HEU00401.1 lipo-like protein [Aurantimonas coralicida]